MEWCAQIQYRGRREKAGLGTNNREAATDGSVRKGINVNGALPLAEKNRGRIGKSDCKSGRREDNHENSQKQFISAMNIRSIGKSWLKLPLIILVAGYLSTRVLGSSLDVWSVTAVGTTNHLTAVAYGHGVYVALGGLFGGSVPPNPASLVVSTNGFTWTPLALATNVRPYGVSFLNDQFIAVGDMDLIMTSPDGFSWTIQNHGTTDSVSDAYPLGGVAFGNGVYVATDRVFGNSCLISTNATNWTRIALLPGNSDYIEMDRVHFDNGLFVAGGSVNNSAILTSTNGNDWTLRLSPVPANIINDSAFGAGRWVAVGDSATIITSTNAVTWVKGAPPATVAKAGVDLHAVVYYDGYFLIVGNSGTVLASTDGLNWASRNSPNTNAALNAILPANASLITVGLYGAIWQSGPLLYLVIGLQPQGAALELASPPGIQCSVQESSDLTHWTNVFSIPVTQQTQTLVDTNALTAPLMFYRAIAP